MSIVSPEYQPVKVVLSPREVVFDSMRHAAVATDIPD
jgi:hypothetical protein